MAHEVFPRDRLLCLQVAQQTSPILQARRFWAQAQSELSFGLLAPRRCVRPRNSSNRSAMQLLLPITQVVSSLVVKPGTFPRIKGRHTHQPRHASLLRGELIRVANFADRAQISGRQTAATRPQLTQFALSHPSTRAPCDPPASLVSWGEITGSPKSPPGSTPQRNRFPGPPPRLSARRTSSGPSAYRIGL